MIARLARYVCVRCYPFRVVRLSHGHLAIRGILMSSILAFLLDGRGPWH